MIALWCASALAGEPWSAGAMATWETTPLRGLWGPERYPTPAGTAQAKSSWYSQAAIHAVGSWRTLTADLSAGSEFGWRVGGGMYTRYSGFRFATRLGVTVLGGSGVAGGEIEPVNVSLGAGAIGWIACCGSSGVGYGNRFLDEPSFTPTVYAADRVWLWEPLGLDLRYEVPLNRDGFHNTVSVGIVYAARE